MALDFRASQTRTNKLIASGSTGTNAKLLFYPFASALNLSGGLNSSVFGTGSIGKDAFLYISGAVGSLNGSSNGAVVAGGDVHVSGNLQVQGRLIIPSGSIGLYGRLFVGNYATTTNTSSNPQTCGQNNWVPNEWFFSSGSSRVFFQAILSAQTGSATSFVRLYNATSGAYVEIGGPGVTELSTSQITPTKLLSVNLTGALNFTTSSAQIYEVRIYTSVNSSICSLGSAEILTQS